MKWQTSPTPYFSPAAPVAPPPGLPSIDKEKDDVLLPRLSEKAVKSETSNKTIDGLASVLGIFLVGGLGGFLYLRGKTAEVENMFLTSRAFYRVCTGNGSQSTQGARHKSS